MTQTKQKRSTPPASLVTDGRWNFGTFDAAIPIVNPLDAERPLGIPLPRSLKACRLKEWQALQFSNQRYFGNVALFNAKTLALAQVKLYDRIRERKVLFEKRLLPNAFSVAQGVLDSKTEYARNGCTIRFRNRIRDNYLEVDLDIGEQPGFPSLRGRLVGQAEGCDPLVVSMPFGDNRGMVSHKGVLNLAGTLKIADEDEDFTGGFAMMDDHKGYYPATMEWDWVTAAGEANGKRIAFNLTRNQCIDPQRYHENCFWTDGRAELLSPVRFERQGYEPGDRWFIRDEHGDVDITFEVQVPGRVYVRAGWFRNDYYGPFGTFNGTINSVSVDDLFGMGERFFLRC